MLKFEYDARQISTGDFEGAASIFLRDSDFEKLKQIHSEYSIMEGNKLPDLFKEGVLDINLVINNASYNYKDYNQIFPNIGNNFYHFFYGKSPMILNLQGLVFNTEGRKGAPEFSALYKYVLRLTMVARTKIMPFIHFKNCIVGGAFLSMNKIENANILDYINFTSQVLVFRLEYFNNDNKNKTQTSITYFKNEEEGPKPA